MFSWLSTNTNNIILTHPALRRLQFITVRAKYIHSSFLLVTTRILSSQCVRVGCLVGAVVERRRRRRPP